jgi:hypothetical protein
MSSRHWDVGLLRRGRTTFGTTPPFVRSCNWLHCVSVFIILDFRLLAYILHTTPIPHTQHIQLFRSSYLSHASRLIDLEVRLGGLLFFAILTTSQRSRGRRNCGFPKRSRVGSSFAGLCASSRPHQMSVPPTSDSATKHELRSFSKTENGAPLLPTRELRSLFLSWPRHSLEFILRSRQRVVWCYWI